MKQPGASFKTIKIENKMTATIGVPRKDYATFEFIARTLRIALNMLPGRRYNTVTMTFENVYQFAHLAFCLGRVNVAYTEKL